MFIAAAERLTQLQSHAMKPRSHGVSGQLTGKRNFVVAQAAKFPHQENITIDGVQPIQGFTNCKCERLCRRKRRIDGQLDRLPPSSIVSHMIQREIPCDAKQPGAPAPFVGFRNGGPGHAEEYFLRQFTCVFAADDSAEIPEYALSVRGEQDIGVGHRWTLPVKDTARLETSQVAATRASAQIGKYS